MPIYCSSSRLGTLGARFWNVTFLQMFLSFRILLSSCIFLHGIHCKLCSVDVVCMIIVGVKNHLCFTQFIASLNLTQFRLYLPWSFRKKIITYKISDVGFVHKFILGISLSKSVGYYRMMSSFRGSFLFAYCWIV